MQVPSAPSSRSAPSGDLGGQRCARTVTVLLRDREQLAWTVPSPRPRPMPSCTEKGKNDWISFSSGPHRIV